MVNFRLLNLRNTAQNAAPVITLHNPRAYEVYQRDGNNRARVRVDGFVSADCHLEYRWDDGWQYLGATSGGQFSFDVELSGGQNDFEIRVQGQPLTTVVPLVGVGDVFVIAGQSNGAGSGVNAQVVSHPTLQAIRFSLAYVWSPYVETRGAGSAWASFATAYMHEQNVPVAIVNTAHGGSDMAQWKPPAGLFYARLAAVIDRLNGVKAILWWQGEDEISYRTPQRTYANLLKTLGEAVQSDFDVPLIACKLQQCPAWIRYIGAWFAVNRAIEQTWGSNNVYRGADLSDLPADDRRAHLTLDASLTTAGSRWWEAVKTVLYT